MRLYTVHCPEICARYEQTLRNLFFLTTGETDPGQHPTTETTTVYDGPFQKGMTSKQVYRSYQTIACLLISYYLIPSIHYGYFYEYLPRSF